MQRVLNSKPRRAGMPLGEPNADGGDSPAWSRKREDYERPDQSRLRSAVPYAELHAHSAYSFLDGASTPEELVEEAARLDLRAIALTDHDGLYGVVRFAEAARELDMRTVFGAELSLGDGARTDVPDPPGPHLLVLARGPGGVPPAVPSTGRRAPGRRRERGAALRLRRAHRGRGRALAHSDRVPQRPCASSAFRRWSGSCRGGAGRPGGPVRRRPGQRRAHPSRSSARRRTQRRAGRAGAAVRGRASSPPPRRTSPEPSRGRLAMAMGAIRARQSLDEGAGWLAPLGGSHLRSGDEMAQDVCALPRSRSPPQPNWASSVRSGWQLIAPQLPPFDVPDGHTEDSWLRELVMIGAADRYGPPERRPAGLRPDRA